MGKKDFQGFVEVYDESIYVNTFTGEGIDRVIARIEPLLCKKAANTYIAGYDFYDIKHELVLIAIDGIKNFNPHKGVKLSTFLHIHINNKLISKVRSENKLSNDAYGLEDREDSTSKIRKARHELPFSQFTTPDGTGEFSFESTIPEENGLYFSQQNMYDRVEFEISLKKLSKKLDYSTRRIIELIYFNDYTIKDAAKEVGLSGCAASYKLRRLSQRRAFRTMFGVEEYEPKPTAVDGR